MSTLELENIKHPDNSGDNIALASNGSITIDRQSTNGTIAEFRKDGTTVGSIGTFGNDVYMGQDDTGIRCGYAGINTLIPFDVNSVGTTDGSSDGVTDLGHSARRFKDLYLSGGVFLGGTASANALDDYEEGTFTVGFQGATVSANNTTALYTKIGDLVTWYWYSSDTTISSASGAAYLTGLPFTVLNTANNYNPCPIAHNTYFGGSTSVGQQAYHLVGNTKVVFNTIGQPNNPGFVNGSGKYLMIQGSYKTAS
jgi:hypothetical protein